MPEVLSFIAAKGILDVGADIKQIIINKMNEGKYAFVPNVEEAQTIINLGKSTDFKTFNGLIPNYRYSDLIRTGMLIRFYFNRNGAGDQDRVKFIKRSIVKRANGRKLLKIVNLAATPYFDLVLNILHNGKREGFSKDVLEEIMDYIVEHWESSALLVQAEDGLKKIKDFCLTHMKKGTQFFFLCGMMAAAENVKKVVADISEKGLLEKYNYSVSETTTYEGTSPRTQMIFQKNLFVDAEIEKMGSET